MADAKKVLFSKLATEFLGTLFLSFTIATAAGQGAELAPIAIGFTLTCAVYAGGHVSGSHYNPAVTLAVALRGKAGSALEIVGYLASEFAGAATGAAIATVFGGGIGYPDVAGSKLRALAAEIILTAALTNTVLNVATSTKTAGNDFFGLAIGCTVLSGAISVGGVSGGCFNPAIAMLCIIRGDLGNVPIYICGPAFGGTVGALLFRLTADDEFTSKPKVPELVRATIVEFWGTFMLCFTVACAASPENGSGGLAALSVGMMLMAQVFTGGAVSGANYNPAVTTAVLVRFQTAGFGPACKKIRANFSLRKAACYYVAQCVASLLAGTLATWIFDGNHGFPYPAAGVSAGQAFVAELMATFFLTYVVLHSATAASNAGNNFFGVAIGFTVASMAVTVGGISGGCFNPAVALLGLIGAGGADRSKIWVYWVACPLAGALAGLTFRIQVFGDFECGASAEIPRNQHALMEYDDATQAHHAYFAENADVPRPGVKYVKGGLVNTTRADATSGNTDIPVSSDAPAAEESKQGGVELTSIETRAAETNELSVLENDSAATAV